MSMTRRTIGIGAFIVFAVIGTGWALDKAANNAKGRTEVSIQEIMPTGALTTPSTDGSTGALPAADTSPEYDRSDLLLSQG